MLDEAAKAADIGVTTDELDRIVHEAAIERDCYPSPLNYYKFVVFIQFQIAVQLKLLLYFKGFQNQSVRKCLN